MDVTFLAGGRPVLLIYGTEELRQLVELVDRIERATAYSGRMPSPTAGAFVRAGRQLLALTQLVPQPEPQVGETGAQTARWITTAEAAELLGITERAVRKRIAAGTLTARTLGGRWLIDLKETPPNAAA